MKNEKDSRISYWWARLEQDSKKLDDVRKLLLVTSVLVNHCQLTPEELSIFLDPTFVPTSADVDKTLRYSVIEKKVARFYNGSPSKKKAPEQDKLRQHNEGFIADSKKALEGFYTNEEIDELFSYCKAVEDHLILNMMLVGSDFYAVRRIRNAYIPGMTTLITGTIDEKGKVRNLQNSTHLLFQGQENAVSQLEGMLGKK